MLSKEYREDLTDPAYTARMVAEHSEVRTIIADPLRNDGEIYITALVEREYDRHMNLTHRDKEYRRIIQEKGVLLNATLKPKATDTIRRLAIDIAKAAITLQQAKVGVNHDKDRDFGTHRHVFCHSRSAYG